MTNNEIEIWQEHPEINIIEVSTLGNVRTLDRVVPNGNGMRLVKGHVLKQNISNNGYMRMNFRVNGKRINKSVHRLVAETFIPNPENLPQVNHKDCDRTNNNVENLEWCDGFYNQQYRSKFGVSNTETQGQPVLAINLTTLEVSQFQSQGEASRELEVNRPNINSVIKGIRNYAGGYWFTNYDNSAADIIKRKLYALQSQALGL